MKCPQCGKEQPDSSLICGNSACRVDFQVLARINQERTEAAAARAEEKELEARASSNNRRAAKDLVILLFLCLAGVAAVVGGGYYSAMKSCQPAEASRQALQGSAAAFYFGQSAFSSVDEKTPYGTTASAARREVSADGSLITETLTQPGRTPEAAPQVFATTMRRRGSTLVYDAEDEGKTFSGTLTFAGPGLDSWTYDIKLAAGGTITGTGAIAGGVLTAKKIFGGSRPVLITDSLKEVSRQEYELDLAAMQAK